MTEIAPEQDSRTIIDHVRRTSTAIDMEAVPVVEKAIAEIVKPNKYYKVLAFDKDIASNIDEHILMRAHFESGNHKPIRTFFVERTDSFCVYSTVSKATDGLPNLMIDTIVERKWIDNLGFHVLLETITKEEHDIAVKTLKALLDAMFKIINF